MHVKLKRELFTSGSVSNSVSLSTKNIFPIFFYVNNMRPQSSHAMIDVVPGVSRELQM